MAATLEETLRSLHDQSGASAYNLANGLIADIRQICLHEISEKDRDYCCSALFDKDIGIIAFLQKVAAKDEFQSTKANLLDFIGDFLQKVGKKLLPYAIDIKEACVSAFSRDKYAKVKNSALGVLVKVLELTVGSPIREEMKIDNLVEKLFRELTKTSKLVPTVKGNIYFLLGVIAEVYPEDITQDSDRLVGLYVSALKAEMTSKTKKPELPIIAGCLQGLTAYLVNFTQSSDEGSSHSYEIFNYARMAIDHKVEFSRYDVPKAGLQLFARHAGQFSQFLVDDYENMYTKLQAWSKHHNRDVLHLGVAAMDAFLRQIAETITEKAKRGIKEGGIFKFFVQAFQTTMQNSSASSKEVSMAVRGYGLFAAPCSIFLEPADVTFMFSEMITKCEQEFLRTNEPVHEKLSSLPDYLHALANIIKVVTKVSEVYALTLERLLVLLFENIPTIYHGFHFTCLKGILHLLIVLQSKGSTFNKVLSGFVYQGLIRTCSHPVVMGADENQEISTAETDLTVKQITYKDYLEVWSGLLESGKIKDLIQDGIGFAERDQLTHAVYNELMQAILKVISKLDLTSTTQRESKTSGTEEEKSDITQSGDPVHEIEANRPMDFQVLINLVDFSRDLLVPKHFQYFEKWVFTFTHTVVVQSTEFPLVSGFYKLLAVTMKIANKLEYFKDIAVENSFKKEEQMDVDETGMDGQTEKHLTYILIKKFSEEVLVRMKKFHDDLLASCLTLILTLPKEIIAQQMSKIVPAIQLTFSVGLSYLPLAEVGLDSLVWWSQVLPPDALAPHYASILPCLDSYLKTVDTGAEDVSVETLVTVSSSKSKYRGKKLPVRLVKERKPVDLDKGYESQLSVVKQKIVTYLGSLGGSMNFALLARREEEISRRAIAWDTEQHLRFDIPFFDMKPSIYFDPFLPHVVELATQSSNRQTKVSACELLHSLILYTLGRSAQQPGEIQKRNPMDSLYRKLFPALLSLSCDVEQVCRQLFEPLVKQLIHWFTGNKMAESPESMALLDSIFDGLVQQDNTMLRDFAAQCLREFLIWSIKQTSKKAMETNPRNVTSILKRMQSFALHPSAFKRLGAALAFNNIYMVFREEQSLVDRFTFQILVLFVESLGIAHQDEASLGTQEQCKKALEHVEKIVCKRVDILRKPSPHRKEPSEWSKQTLDIAVRWLVRQCGRPQTECRHACMQLMYKLAPLIPGISSPFDYFKAALDIQNASYFVVRFEGGGQVGDRGGLCGHPTPSKVAENFSLKAVLSWFDMLLAVLDCYCWVFGEGLLSPAKMFESSGFKGTRVFSSLQYFVTEMALGDLSVAAKQFQRKAEAVFFTPKEKDDYNKLQVLSQSDAGQLEKLLTVFRHHSTFSCQMWPLTSFIRFGFIHERVKCTVLIRIWNFLTVLIARYPSEAFKVIPQTLFCDDLWRLCIRCVVQPSSVGFNMGDIEIITKLPQEMMQVLKVLSKQLPLPERKELVKILEQELKGKGDLFGQIPISLTSSSIDYTNLQQTVDGYCQLHDVRILLEVLGKHGQPEKLAELLFDSVLKGITEKKDGKDKTVSLSPAAHRFASQLLKLAFQLGLPAEKLVEGILDVRIIQGLSLGIEYMLGDHFFTLFKTPISSHVAASSDVVSLLMNKATVDPHRVCNVLVAMLENVAQDRRIRKSNGPRIVDMVASKWHHLESWWQAGSSDLQGLAVLLLTKLLLVDSKAVLNVEKSHFTTVFTSYCTILAEKKTNLAFKNRALDVLPFFAAVPDAKLKDVLDGLVADNFPLRSSELTKGTPRFVDYICAIDKLLSALELSSSLVLLELLISIFCREEGRHVHEDAIQQSLNTFTARLPAEKQKDALDVPYKIVFCESGFQDMIRRTTLERVCLPILRCVHKAALIEFFLDHILDLMRIVEQNLAKGPESILKTQLTSKVCCFQLLEVMYSRLSREEVNSLSSEINKKVCFGKPETGKEMTQKIIKAANNAKSEDTRGDFMVTELRRQYHCYSYNLLIAIICCVQNEHKFYKGFLFQDNTSKGQFLLENIVDRDQKYEFPLELESQFERKKKFVAIRSEMQEKQSDKDGGISSYHLASQYLTESSLSEDLSKYEFTVSGSAQNTSGIPKTKASLRKNSSYGGDNKVRLDGDYVELEMDALNSHECMAPLVALLKHIHKNNIFPAAQSDASSQDMPQWMEFLHDKMTKNTGSDTLNIRLFIAKLIINTSEIFQPFARLWLRPLCQLILSTSLCDNGINYFIMDLLVTMLSWHSTAVPQNSSTERAMASRLVEFLVRNVHHETRAIFRNNLEMLKTLLECWKDCIEIPYQEVYNQLKMPDPSSKSSLIGIQVLGVIMTCNYAPYGPSASVDRNRYFTTLASSMTNSSKMIFAAAAEVVGMVFAYLADKENETDGQFHSHVESVLGKVSPHNFLVCVHCIHRHHPPMADRFLNKLLFMLPGLHGEFRVQCLEVIMGRIEQLDDAFRELQSKGLLNFLTQRDEDTQIVALGIVNAMVPKLSATELQTFLPAITGFSNHPSVACRQIMMKILMWTYDNYRDNESKEGQEIMKVTQESLLQGLCDDNLHCRLTMQNFWSSESRLPDGTVDRMIAILEAMYTPGSECNYLSYATNLLLEMTSKSPDYDRQIFEHPLSECTFRDYSVQSSWRQRHAVMTPLFAVTQGSETMEDVEDSLRGGIRATVDVEQFTATMETGSNAPFNWLTQSSLDTFADASLMETNSLSSLLFTVGSSSKGGASKTPVATRHHHSGTGSNFGKQMARTECTGNSAGPKNDNNTPDEDNVWKLRRRFLKDRSTASKYFARREIKEKSKREERLKQQRLRRENQVTLYRRYRIGDLPDIQIKYSYIIAPLQALAHRDNTIAKLLFGAVFKAIYQEMDKVKTDQEMEETKEKINDSLGRMLSTSIHYFTPFMACVMDILHTLRSSLKVEVSELSIAAKISNLQPLGIEVIEERLITEDSGGARPSKRSRYDVTPVTKDDMQWIELAKLYKSLGEFDVLHGIFSGMLKTKEVTQLALIEESHSEYKAAIALYNKALESADHDPRPLEAEIDLWDESRMECLNRLTEWTKLEMVTTDALSQEGEISLASVWDDTYYMETYLPYLIRSKLKLLLHGDEKQQSLLSFIDDSMKNPQHRAHLESRYCEDLALMYVWQKNFDLARHYARLAVQSFFQDWSSTDSLMTASRTHCLQRLQPLLELQEFLDFVADKNNFTSFEPSHQLIARWEQRYPHVQLDLVDIWDDVVTNRNVYMDKIRDQMLSSNLMEEDHDSSIFEDIKLRQQLKLAHSCQEQNNFNLTLRILKETYSKCKREKSELLVVEWSHLYATTHQKKALSCSGIWSKDMLYNVLSTLDPLSKVAESKMLREKPALGMRHMILESRTFDAIVTGLISVGNLEELGDKTCEKLQQYTKSPLNKGDLIKELIHHGYQSLRKVISEVPEDSSRDAVCLQQDVQLALAKYCDKYLRLAEENDGLVASESMEVFPATAVKCLLDAMRAGSAEALERFPRLLHIIEHYPDTTDMFLKKSETIPSWMFILWISQMMALLDKHQAHAVRPIILRIATEYPQAIVYPFHISQESFAFGSTAEDRRNKQGIEELDALLSEERVPLVRTFISALEQFSQPVQMFQDWSRDITKILEKRPAAEIKKKYKEIYDMLLEMPHKGEQSGTQAQQTSFGAVSMGEFHRRFAEVFKNEFDNHFGVDGSKLVTMTAKEFSGILRNLQAQFEKHKADLTPPTTIGKYCSWMANFNPNHESRELEIPGQYDGLRKPMPEYHVKVAGFDERVLVMSSLRRPKRITIRGNDEKDYHYLVKGGEDLRQDQRIEQLFVLMNKVLEKDPVCKARRLVLKTYQVIPMNTRVGLIEWMSNTIPLKEFLLNAMTEKERTAYFGENGPSQLHYKWLPKLPKKTDWGLIYGQVYQNYSKTETMKEFRIKESKVPWDLSRRALQHLSTSPEAFHFLRCEMLTSHAVLCICHYLLGIGDRHLSNFMVNGRTGHMVGIDFGHAFGSATQFIPVPELMVFRLTRQIVNLGLPFKVKGLLENTMIHVLHALRQNHDLLLSTMDVFVKEVSLDWLQFAERQMRGGMGPKDADEDMRWYPKQKIETAARKLKGDNPSYITRDELRIGHLRNQALKDFEKVALGDVQDNIRARLKEKGLTEEQQVAALIDQATDPNILGRTWGGWEPWL